MFTKFASYKVPPVMVSTHGSVVPLAMFLSKGPERSKSETVTVTIFYDISQLPIVFCQSFYAAMLSIPKLSGRVFLVVLCIT